MKLRLLTRWDAVRTSFWFVPALMVAAAMLLWQLTFYFDRQMSHEGKPADHWFWASGPEGARTMMGAIASSTITVTGVVFSITMVVLTLATQKFGPRLLRSFMRDTGNQLTLGTFVGTFVYCLLVLWTIRSGEDAFVPFISLLCGMFLGLISTGVLIYFIHHVSSSIQVENLVAHIGAELKESIDRLYSGASDKTTDEEQDAEESDDKQRGDAHEFCAWESNYLQTVDEDILMELAVKHNLLLKLPQRPGEFVLEGNALARVWSQDAQNKNGELPRALMQQMKSSFVVGPYRTASQDPEYSVQQLVEVAARALSPGVNEPFTALACLEWLSAALAQLAQRPLPACKRYDKSGQLRLEVSRVTFAGMTDAALNLIRQHGCSNPAVAIRMLEVLCAIAPHLQREEDRQTLLAHADLIKSDSSEKILNQRDLQDVEQRYQSATETLSNLRF